MEYNNEEDRPEENVNKSIKGYKIVIIVLVITLGALSFQYFKQVKEIKTEFAIEKDTLTNQIEALVFEYEQIEIANDTITQSLNQERYRVDSLFTKLKSERTWSGRKIREYEQKITLLRGVMTGYVHQIDSLNQINKSLVTENIQYRKEVSSQKLRAEMAEEKSSELSTKIEIGSVVRARDIQMLALRTSDRETTRASRAERLRVDFILSSNDLTSPGDREIFLRVIGPDGYVLADDSNNVFDFEGDVLTYSAVREVEYQNQDLGVSIYYNGTGITSGTYKIALYMDGHNIGFVEAILK